ncbi:MAG: hypothetical protein FJW31_06105 [Acidobacteria bacterium]|nr:hypothetical protein [Acidobacteriota bacterium]
MADGKEWTTRNVDVVVEPSSCEENAAANCAKLGASMNETRAYGALLEEDKTRSQAAFKALRPGGASGFDALLSGGRTPEGENACGEAHGFYWTATESDASHAWFYNLGRGMGAVNRHADGEKKRAFAARCVRAAATPR